MENTHLNPCAKWQGHPLCCGYLLVHFAPQPIRVRVGGAEHSWHVTWALGTLSDGQREVLGTWLHSIGGVSNWQVVFDELAVRGVERIRFVVGADVNMAQGALLGATTLPFDAQRRSANPEPFPALSLRLQNIMDSAQMQTRALQRELERLTRRHGAFDSAAASSEFLDRAIERIERRLWIDNSLRSDSLRQSGIGEPRAAAL